MKVGFIGCVESSAKFLEVLCAIERDDIEVVGVVTLSASAVNSDYCDLAPICSRYDIPYFYHERSNAAGSREFLKELTPDVIYCFGWSYLLDESVLSIAPFGVIGFHPAKLPQNRGRHPIIWALALGLEETASTFFKMDLGADSGPILSQKLIKIESCDNATSLYEKILAIAKRQVHQLTIDLADGVAIFQEQDHDSATHWRKRSRKDGLIDWRMHASTVHNLVRALSRPYPGAEFIFEGQHIQVWDSEVAEKAYPKNIEPGTVLEVNANSFVVKCADITAINIKEISPQIELEKGRYL